MKSAADKLQGRQREILEMLAEGKQRKEIAEQLGIHRATLNTYIDRLYARLDAKRPVQALANFLKLEHPRLNLF